MRGKQGQAGPIGAARQLQGARRRPGAHRLQQGHRRPGSSRAHIATHGPAIELPEGPQTRLAQQAEALPKLAGQLPGAGGPGPVVLQPTTHRQAPQGHATGQHLLQAGRKDLATTDAGMDLDRVGAKLSQQGGHGGGAEHRLALPNQAEGTGWQATATAVAAIGLHPAPGADRQGRTDPLAGPGAIRRTEARIEAGLAEMGVIAIAQADH